MTDRETERARREIQRRIQEEGVECPRCGGTEFEIEVWDVGMEREEPRGAIVCLECRARLNVESTI